MTETSEAVEHTPLVPPSHKRIHDSEPSCLPRDPKRRHLQENLYRTCHVPALQPHVPRNSPVLIEFVKKRITGEQVTDIAKQRSNDAVNNSSQLRRWTRAVYALAFMCMAMMASISPTMLLYLHHTGLTQGENIRFYVTCSVISAAVPVFSHVGIGYLTAKFGPSNALFGACMVVALGLAGMIAFPNSKLLFGVAYGLYSLSQSIRTVRTTILSQVVPAAERTSAMSYHALMTPLGGLLGPILWLIAERYPYDERLFGSIRGNRFTVDYAIAGAIAIAMGVIAITLLGDVPHEEEDDKRNGNGHPPEGIHYNQQGHEVLHVHLPHGGDYDVDTDSYRNRIFLYFCFIMLNVNLAMGLYMVSFQPIMVHRFGADGQKLGVIFEIIAVTAIIPPLLVAYLSRRLKDRDLLLIGLAAKLLGVALFLPIFGAVREWQVIAGFVLMIKASIFFFTSSMSLFTKLLGRMSSGLLLGFLSSMSALGPAVAQLAFADYILQLFGTFSYGLFALPVVCATMLVVAPWFWTRLDPDREFNQALHSEFDRVHPHA